MATAPTRAEWLQGFQEALPFYSKGRYGRLLAILAPLHVRMELDIEQDDELLPLQDYALEVGTQAICQVAGTMSIQPHIPSCECEVA